MATQKNIVEEVFPETLKILSDLIKFQTVSGSSNIDLIEYCEKKLNEAKMKIETIQSSGKEDLIADQLTSIDPE